MDDHHEDGGPQAAVGSEPLDAAYDDTSQEYVGRWNRLVSQTNWEKGRIILEWRQALEQSEAPVTQYSDEAWARRVGNVSSQHVGRLRRVYERFGDVAHEYTGLYWSHFQAALDWHDAEMWLEGAVQNVWSVSQMRAARWEALGAPADRKPRDEDIITAEFDEDVGPDESETVPTSIDEVVSPDGQDDEAEEPPSPGEQRAAAYDAAREETEDAAEASPAARPLGAFADLEELPEDVAEAFEAFKLAIVRHKHDDWQEVSRDQLVAVLEALKQLALAPADD